MKRLLLIFALLSGYAFGQASPTTRIFNGSSDNLQSSATVDLSSTKIVSLFWKMKWDTFANNDALAMESSPNFNNAAGAFLINPNSSSSTQFDVNVQTAVSGTPLLICSFPRPSAGVVHKYLVVWDLTLAAGTCKVWVDGVDQAPTVTNQGNEVSVFFGNLALNVMSRNAALLFGAGTISDITIWKTARNATDATNLVACIDPSTIDTGNVLNYWPIKGVSPETPNIGAVNLNVTGTTTAASDCSASGGGKIGGTSKIGGNSKVGM